MNYQAPILNSNGVSNMDYPMDPTNTIYDMNQQNFTNNNSPYP